MKNVFFKFLKRKGYYSYKKSIGFKIIIFFLPRSISSKKNHFCNPMFEKRLEMAKTRNLEVKQCFFYKKAIKIHNNKIFEILLALALQRIFNLKVKFSFKNKKDYLIKNLFKFKFSFKLKFAKLIVNMFWIIAENIFIKQFCFKNFFLLIFSTKLLKYKYLMKNKNFKMNIFPNIIF